MIYLRRLFWTLVMLFSTVIVAALWFPLTTSPAFPRWVGVALWLMFLVGVGRFFFGVFPRPEPVPVGRHEAWHDWQTK